MKFCEELLCGSIRQPANAFSNIGFVICGLLIISREGLKTWTPYHMMGLAAVSIGITSGIYHASMVFFWQFFDLSSMFMLILLPLAFNLVRSGWIKASQFSLVYIVCLSISMLLLYVIQGKVGEYIFGVHVAMVTGLEFLLYRRGHRPTYAGMLKALGTFMLAFLIWNGDVHGWWCDPTNHYLQGHAIWHLLCALAIWFLYGFYKQFAQEEKSYL
jgi:hypothetical protein